MFGAVTYWPRNYYWTLENIVYQTIGASYVNENADVLMKCLQTISNHILPAHHSKKILWKFRWKNNKENAADMLPLMSPPTETQHARHETHAESDK